MKKIKFVESIGHYIVRVGEDDSEIFTFTMKEYQGIKWLRQQIYINIKKHGKFVTLNRISKKIDDYEKTINELVDLSIKVWKERYEGK